MIVRAYRIPSKIPIVKARVRPVHSNTLHP